MFIHGVDVLIFRYERGTEKYDLGEILRSLKEEGITYEIADRHNVEELFGSNPVLYGMFRNMLAGGCVGYILRKKKEWVAYGWLSLPSSKFFPPHLPVKITSRDAAWLFYARTNVSYRGRGCHKAIILLRVGHIQNVYADLPIYADIIIGNISSISAKQKTGFVPCGRLRGIYVSLPWMGSVMRLGKWDKEAGHPIL